MSIRVSVVVPTYKRPQLLRDCLNALVRQDFLGDEFEIIIVDDGDTQETRSLVDEFSGETRSKVTGPSSRSGSEAGARPTILYAAATDTQGPAAARNLGWRTARGEIIAFTDDDCLPEPDWLKEGVAALDGGLHVAIGQVIVPVPRPPSDYEMNVSRLSTGEFVTANCFIKRCVLKECGGFDERFRMAWREDSDLHFRILESSFALGRAPAAKIIHPVRQAPWGVSIKEQRKSMYNALLYKKYPKLYRARIQARAPVNYYVIVLSALVFLLSLALELQTLMLLSAVLWLGLTLQFTFKRLEQTRRAPGHVLEMLYTSIIIPPVSVFWRLYGAFRYRVLFF